jgi:hypothetical protein
VWLAQVLGLLIPGGLGVEQQSLSILTRRLGQDISGTSVLSQVIGCVDLSVFSKLHLLSVWNGACLWAYQRIGLCYSDNEQSVVAARAVGSTRMLLMYQTLYLFLLHHPWEVASIPMVYSWLLHLPASFLCSRQEKGTVTNRRRPKRHLPAMHSVYRWLPPSLFLLVIFFISTYSLCVGGFIVTRLLPL